LDGKVNAFNVDVEAPVEVGFGDLGVRNGLVNTGVGKNNVEGNGKCG
jgi:hypothetical protein